ncbi:cytochrome c [Viridibacillus sp. YIM B01967]|uniref:Cytochrome c n=1 Tax=Viridibacillus soli TaxID=2798301 RepID=A0ABS1H1Y3_9BACL|nr:cytochrome c [Viridibacillus soli]MBK3493311.1 cytochrome c [Viridibacillus soli]
MKKNPIIPYILIMAFGIGLIFFMSLGGPDKKAEIAKGDEGKTEESAGAFDPEAAVAKSCVACHGENLEGGGGPNLHGTGLSADEVKEILHNGKGGMPAGILKAESEANIEAVAKYIADLK